MASSKSGIVMRMKEIIYIYIALYVHILETYASICSGKYA